MLTTRPSRYQPRVATKAELEASLTSGPVLGTKKASVHMCSTVEISNFRLLNNKDICCVL